MLSANVLEFNFAVGIFLETAFTNIKNFSPGYWIETTLNKVNRLSQSNRMPFLLRNVLKIHKSLMKNETKKSLIHLSTHTHLRTYLCEYLLFSNSVVEMNCYKKWKKKINKFIWTYSVLTLEIFLFFNL